jgi:dienelactone hydrolase
MIGAKGSFLSGPVFNATRVLLCAGPLLFAAPGFGAGVTEAVRFMSRDGSTRLTGYLFKPDAPGPHPAIVLLHGRSGPYSSRAQGLYTADTLTMRHKMWARFWAESGYLALHVDSFGPRGYPAGFPRHSYRSRPPAVSEQLIRPLDAYGAIDYLRGRGDVIADRIGVQGWSNGAMTILAAMASEPPELKKPTPASGFRAALALYPSCRFQEKQPGYRPYAPLLILSGEDDDEVSARVCQRFVQAVKEQGGEIEFVLYDGAHHSFDDPGRRKQSHEPNRAAMEDSMRRAVQFFGRHLR